QRGGHAGVAAVAVRRVGRAVRVVRRVARGVVGVVRLDVRQDGAHVGLRGRLVRAILEAEVRRHRDREQDAEDDDDDQELDQGEALLGAEARLYAGDHLDVLSFHREDGGWLVSYR